MCLLQRNGLHIYSAHAHDSECVWVCDYRACVFAHVCVIAVYVAVRECCVRTTDIMEVQATHAGTHAHRVRTPHTCA